MTSPKLKPKRIFALDDVWVPDKVPCHGEDPTLFDPADIFTYRRAVAICAECPLIARCAQEAVQSDAWGVWGGGLYASGRRYAAVTARNFGRKNLA